MTAHEGLAWGFFNDLYESTDLLANVQATARALADGPTFAHGMTKTMLSQEWSMTIEQAKEDVAKRLENEMRGSVHDSMVLGMLGMGAQSGIIDYSRKDTDEFGETTFLRRAFADEARGPLPPLANIRPPARRSTVAGSLLLAAGALAATRVGYDAETTEIVAASHDGDPGIAAAVALGKDVIVGFVFRQIDGQPTARESLLFGIQSIGQEAR
mgnify:CR=1 FL=1